MSTKDELIKQIVKKEWEMFSSVQNEGGRAACQDDYRTFEINRCSQATSWSQDVLESYLSDLESAASGSRNLMTEKYARMMKSTAPMEYANVEHMLPPLAPEAPSLIEKISAIVLSWEEELERKYPYVLQMGRPLRSSEDSPNMPSLETYLKSEFATYSLKTLKLYLENVEKQRRENINGSQITMEHMVKLSGFASLEEANDKMKR